MRTFTKAILRKPPKSFVNALAQNPHHTKPEYGKTLDEHFRYAKTLEKMGVRIKICESDERYPDSNFVEDTHLILGGKVIIELNPGAVTRAGEPMSLAPFLPTGLLHYTLSKKYGIDGGDILEDGDQLYVGLSARTQKEAIEELANIVTPFGYEVHSIPVPSGLHLKSGMTCILPNHFIIQSGFLHIIQDLQKKNNDIKYFVVPDDEDYAANVLPINGKIMIPQGCPKAKEYIAKYYDVKDIYEVNTEQVRLVDGALTCGCLLFA